MKGLKLLYFADGDNSVHDKRFLSKMQEREYNVCAVYFCRAGGKYAVEGMKKFYLGYEKYQEKGIIGKLLGYLLAYLRFKNLLTEIKPEILYAGWIPSCGFTAALSNYHPFFLKPWASDILLLPKRSWFFKKIAQFTIKRADMITCDSKIVKQEIIRLTGYPEEKIVVFPFGIDLSLFQPDNLQRVNLRKKFGLEEKKVIIMNRNFEPVYGIEYFLRALPLVWAKVPNICVLLIGSGSLEGKLRELVEELKLEPVVKFIGEVPNREMPGYLNASDLYVSSSLSDGTSNSLLEAMACGLPVVVTDVPAILEWVTNGENGFVVPRQSVEELAEAIIHLLKNEDIAIEMGKKNLEIAKERADWDKNFRKFEEICLGMLHRPNYGASMPAAEERPSLKRRF
jgi:glycosyltransferase involved in cell wall biosynthesis